MGIDFEKCNEKELWEFVAVHLKKRGIDTTLVGGAVVAIYSKGAYHSGDLDFVKMSLFTKDLEKAMLEIGFVKKAKHFVNPKCKHLFIEFPGSIPIGIGEEKNIVPEERLVEGTVIKILSATDCVKDRLASYIYFKTKDALDQAVLVAQNQDVDIHNIKKWCHNEDADSVFVEFSEALKQVK